MPIDEILTVVERLMRLRGFALSTVDAKGHPVAQYEFGGRRAGAKKIVLVHGLGNNSVIWVKVLGALGRHHHVRAPDLPGFGRTPLRPGQTFSSISDLRDVLIDYLDALGEGPYVLVGHSLGGWASGKVALARPDLVEQLILVNTGGILYPQVHELRELLLASSQEELKAFWKRLWHRIPLMNRLLISDYIGRMDEPRIHGLLDSMQADDFLNHELQDIRVPVSVLWGASDRFIPRLCVDILLRGLPETRIVWMPECGHIPQLEKPKHFTQLVRDLAVSCPPAPPP